MSLVSHDPLLASNSFTQRVMLKLPRFPLPRRRPRTASVYPTWRPVTLRVGCLAFMTFLSIMLSLLVLFLTYYSEKNLGIADYEDDAWFKFYWNYLPTLIATIFAVFWALMEYDTKRTEPFARLARPEGCSAKNSLFLTRGIPGINLFHALSKRRGNGRVSWTLFWAGLGHLIAFLVIIPLSSGLIEPQMELIWGTENFNGFKAFDVQTPIKASNERLEVPFYSTMAALGHGVNTSIWTTEKLFVMPFWPGDMGRPSGVRIPGQYPEIWNGNTTVYSAKLVCEPLKKQFFIPEGNKTSTSVKGLRLYNGEGCEVNVTNLLPDTEWEGGTWRRSDFVAVRGGINSPVSSQFRFPPSIGAGCDGQVLYYRDSAKGLTAASLCKDQYLAAEMAVTIHTSGINSTIQLDDPLSFERYARPLTEGIFNSSGYIRKTFIPDDQFYTRRAPPGLGLVGFASGLPILGSKVEGPMIFLSAKYNNDTTFLAVQERLELEAQTVFQRFFAEFMDTTVSRMSTPDRTLEVKRARLVRRIVVSRVLAIMISSFLSLSALILLGIFVSSKRRKLGLYKDVATIAELATLILESSDLKRLLAGMDSCTEQQMAALMKDCVVRLESKDEAYELKLMNPEMADTQSLFWLSRANASRKKEEEDWRPFPLRYWFCFVFFALLVIYFTVALYLWIENSRRGGLGSIGLWLGKDLDVVGNQIALYSIVPTVLALLVKLPWTSLDETYRRLQPFAQLVREPSNAQRTVTANFNSPLYFWSTWLVASSGYWFLTLVTIGSLGMEALTLGMAAMLERGPAIITYSFPVNQTMEPLSSPLNFGNLTSIMSAGTFNNFKYQALISSAWNGTLPPWTNQEYAFIPMDINLPAEKKVNMTGNWTVETTAVYVNISCETPESQNTQDWFEQINTTSSDSAYPKGGYILSRDFQPKAYEITPPMPGVKTKYDWQGAISPKSYLGYWSKDTGGFNVTWISGAVGGLYTDGEWVFTQPPKATFLRCEPTLMNIKSKVTINPITKTVLGYETLGQATTIKGSDQPKAVNQKIQFAPMGLKDIFGEALCNTDRTYDDDGGMRQYYTMIERGVWMDYMSYAMYSKYKHDPDALHNSDTLSSTVDSTVKTFFSHFAARAQGQHQYWAYQNKTSPTTVMLLGSEERDQLVMSSTATYICLSVLALAGITVLISLWESRMFRVLRRDFATVGSVLGMVYSSENLLSAVKGTERLLGNEAMKWMKDSEYGIGYFTGADGIVHYGIEQEPVVRSRKEGRKKKKAGAKRQKQRQAPLVRYVEVEA